MTDAPPRQPGDDPAAQLVSALAANGFPRMPAAVLMAIMMSEDGALTADRLAEALGASPAAISGAVRYLETVNMIRRHRRPGSRRFEYELPADSWYTASMAKSDLYRMMATLADEAASRVGPRGSERIAEMAEFFRFVESRMPLVLEEWQVHRRGIPEKRSGGAN